MCPGCQVKPVSTYSAKYCFDCRPVHRRPPPPCRRCGSGDYYTAGLCQRCHPSAPALPDSCPDCDAWGLLRGSGGMCLACRAWRKAYPGQGACRLCGSFVYLHSTMMICRLCRCQAPMVRKKTLPADAKAMILQGGRQLFLANADQRQRLGTTRRSPPPPLRPPQPGLAPIRPVDYRQLTLLDPPRDLAAGLRAGLPPPPGAALVEAFDHLVAEHAERYGWPSATCFNVRRGLRIVLALQETPGALIKASDILLLGQVPSAFQVARTIEIVELAGMLDDDRIPAIVTWFDTKIIGLPGPMREELRLWFEVMRHGSTTPTRRRPRTEGTIRMKLSRALPALHRWADQHTSLREISKDDVLAVLPASRTPRVGVVQGLRSIFTVLKEHKLVFINPTARISVGSATPTIPLPLDLDALRNAIHSNNPARAALASLQAFHALRPRQLRQL
jgi:hypothetical protein